MDQFRAREKQVAVRKAEEAGQVADSHEVRLNLIARFKAGEITFDEMQAELKRIKRGAKRAGKTTRAAVFRST